MKIFNDSKTQVYEVPKMRTEILKWWENRSNGKIKENSILTKWKLGFSRTFRTGCTVCVYT